jgi:hypothetical protein
VLTVHGSITTLNVSLNGERKTTGAGRGLFMRKIFVLLLIGLTVVFGLFAFSQDNAPKPDSQTNPDSQINKDQCLACHGPFDKIAKDTAGYQTPSGETVTPHQYVPHDEKKEIPECTNCHKQHPIPPTEKPARPQAIDFCYSGCHHAQNLQPCNNCH